MNVYRTPAEKRKTIPARDVELLIQDYREWLLSHPQARAYVFPASKSGRKHSDTVRDAFKHEHYNAQTVAVEDYS